MPFPGLAAWKKGQQQKLWPVDLPMVVWEEGTNDCLVPCPSSGVLVQELQEVSN